MRTVILGIDTATSVLACGLLVDGVLVAAQDQEGGAQASARLLPTIQTMLRGAGLTPSDVSAVAFGQGPGAFTGVRTAVAAAQGLALGTGAALLAIDSLMIEAQLAADAQEVARGAAVAVAVDARMGEVYSASYRSRGVGRWDILESACVGSPSALAGSLPQAHPHGAATASAPADASFDPSLQPALLAGDGWLLVRRAAFPEALSEPVAVPVAVSMPTPMASTGARATALMRLALAAWEDGAALQDPALAQPSYVRDRVALTTEERRRGDRL